MADLEIQYLSLAQCVLCDIFHMWHQKQWENEIALLLERDSILQGMLIRNSVSSLHHAEREGRKVTTTRKALLTRET